MDQNEEAAEVALSAVDELAEMAQAKAALEAEVKDLNEQLLRRAAEFQNYRRRTDAELGTSVSRGRGEVVLALLDVYDDLRRSLDAAEKTAEQEPPGPAYDALHEGVELVYKKFSDILARFGVEPIEAVGQPFDEALHDAMMQQPAPDAETASGTVLAEIQPGYRMGERVLRHAQVVVAQ
ncbi:MAG: nucleotide exchange factor GrpE [Rhodothermaceae bacterium]|nr:nucleotide exchange factor GrpE [Rhodothermaceae bacterium]